MAGVITCYISADYEGFSLKFKYGRLHVKHVVATWKYQELSQNLLQYTGKPRKICVEMAGLRTFRVPTYSQPSGIKKKVFGLSRKQIST
jgi:hypothetical protein